MARLANGATFAHFTVEALLGQGGMGEVYRVRHQKLGRVQALKILHTTDEVARARLMKEARLQASLLHPNVVAVTDVLEVEDELGVVMEFVDGPPLQTWVSAYRPTLPQRLEVFRGALAGVSAAHHRGLVHRDLKPANILIAFWDGRPVPKVADFGIAKNLESLASQASLTRRGSSLGTPRYMAPEQIEDSKEVDHRADIFSMGCVLYELVCERPAYPHDNPWAAMAAIRGGRYHPPRELVPDLPEPVCRAIEGCLVPDRDQRIPDCEALLAVLDGAPIRPASPAPPVQPVASTNTGNSTQDFVFGTEEGGGPAEGGDLAPVTPSSPGPTLSPTTGAGADAPSARHRRVWAAGGVVAVATLALAAWWYASGGPISPAPVEAPVEPPPVAAEPAPEAFPSLPEPAPEPVAAPSAPETPSVVQPARPSSRVSSRPVEPAATAEPAVPAPTTGTFRSEGDVSVFLEGAGRRYREGQAVEPGTYTIHALFSGADYVVAGSVQISAGQESVLRCHRGFRRCEAD